MADDGWALEETQHLRIRLLEWLYDLEQANPGRTANINDFEPEYPDRPAVDRLAQKLIADGHLADIPRRLGGGPRLRIAREGAALVGWYRSQRNNVVERERNCEAALVAWLYEQRSQGQDNPAAKEFLQNWRSTFWGEPYTEADVIRATGYLRDRGFITGPAAWGHGVYRPCLTGAGVQYARVGHEPSRAATAGTSYTANFNGPISGMVGVGEHVEQTQHQGIDAARLLSILQPMQDVLDDLDDDDRDDIELQIGALEAEATKQNPDADAVRRRVTRLHKIATRMGNPALTTAVTITTTELLRALGVG